MDELATRLDIASKCAQIAFFGTTGTLAVLTYRNAVRGIWSPVNSEYYKRVIEALAKLSDDLLTEFDATARAGMLLPDLHREFIAELLAIETSAQARPSVDYVPEYPAPVRRLAEMEQRVASDPFIPNAIAERVHIHLITRLDVYTTVFGQAFSEYSSAGAASSEAREQAWQRVADGLKSRGFDEIDLLIEAHEIRTDIKSYLSSFLTGAGKTPRDGAARRFREKLRDAWRRCLGIEKNP